MSNKNLICKYGLIGENLDLKQNINLEINQNGKITKISCDNISKNVEFMPNNQNFLIIPGFINSHVHIGDSFAKESGYNRGLDEIVKSPHGLKHQLLDKTSKAIKIRGIKNALLEMLSNGITCFVDFRERGIEGINLIKEILVESPMRTLIFGRSTEKTDIKGIFKVADGIGLASYRKISSSIKADLKELKNDFKKPVACHISELKRDENLIKEMFFDNIVDIIVHGTHLNNDDLELIKKKNKSLILCPRCNGYFGVGFPPINDIINLKLAISLGTDNLMANSTDLFEEMRYLYFISRVMNKETKLTAKELLKMVTINAARIFKLDDSIGSISEGKYANFFMIDLNAPNFYSANLNYNMLIPLIVQRTNSSNIKETYIKGECVFERK